MLLWIAFAAMTGLALMAVFVPLARARSAVASGTEGDIAVYRDQLQAIDEEVARGIIGENEAEAARTEISRRLLAAGERRDDDIPSRPASATRYSGLAVALAVGVITVGLAGYLAIGSPELPGEPLAQRQAQPPGAQDPQMLIAKVEAHLQSNPQDGRGWDLLAPVYMELDRFADAARAYANALRLLGEDAERLAGLGQALTHAESGMVTATARQAFERALVLDPRHAGARFYLALAFEQEGALNKAAEAWGTLLAIAPVDAPWRPVVEQHLAAVKARLGEEEPAPEANAAPDGRALSPTARTEMVEQMVARLAERLKSDDGDLDGWVMLMRSYTVLGRDVEARETLARARERFADDRAALETIEAAAGDLGLNDAAPPSGGPT